MKRPMFALVAGIAAGMIWVGAERATAQSTGPQSMPSQSSSQSSAQSGAQKAPAITLTGCLTQGSGPTVFILDNARANPQDRTEKGKSFIVTASAASVDLKQQLNHEVRVSGSADASVAAADPAGGKVDEKDMPKLEAASLVSVASSCQAG